MRYTKLHIRQNHPGAACLAALASCAALATVTVAAHAHHRAVVTLQGSITAACSVTGSSAVSPEIGDITKAGSKETEVTVDCNTPFKYRLVSLNGALQHELAGTAAASAPKGLDASVPYNVTVVIPTDGGTIRDTCASANIKAGQVTCAFGDSRNGIAIGAAARVTIAWTSPRDAVMAGQYSDRLTFTVEVKP
jgi:hypothetical protein